MNSTGNLYLVATPIGNLEDITLRAIRILKEVDLILCENSRNSSKLFQNFEIKTTYKTLYAGQEKSYKWILDELKGGKNIAYVSDAGTPGISDPGAGLVRIARREGLSVIPIPGPSALSAILSVSGFQANPTYFLGFLSEKVNRKRLELEQYVNKEGLIVIYESVYKVKSTLEIIKNTFPGTEVLIGRELTKSHEEIKICNSEDINIENIYLKGEFVILINNYVKKIAKGKESSSDRY